MLSDVGGFLVQIKEGGYHEFKSNFRKFNEGLKREKRFGTPPDS